MAILFLYFDKSPTETGELILYFCGGGESLGYLFGPSPSQTFDLTPYFKLIDCEASALQTYKEWRCF